MSGGLGDAELANPHRPNRFSKEAVFEKRFPGAQKFLLNRYLYRSLTGRQNHQLIRGMQVKEAVRVKPDRLFALIALIALIVHDG